MKRLAQIVFALMVVLASANTQAETGGYRVEVIVFQNLVANVEAVEVDKLHSFANFPDLQDESLPEDLVVLTDRSERMEGIWRRLRSSKGYRPLVYSSWVQNTIDYYPPFRIHDEEIVESQIRSPGNIVVADLQSQDPLKAYRNDFYRLDGSVQLRRSRFLHINLDLEYRVPATARPQQIMVSTQPGAEATAAANLSEHDVYRLKQSRQVKTDKLQYFDSPWFGALVLVIPIAAEPLATEPVQ